ncbi:DUF1573 domain-containing protein [Anditalea andensis]|uniref:DUF1573 domain-containing protein n=1 Tax=Anditalea andensis TaxID=1048983 RepID=A0A074LGD1_9BACT|nr:DUF1573 domain-containing protein [Anditalea andensis]KEO72852.1 hypothetical protein EL17_14595 [Anditalea andensis]
MKYFKFSALILAGSIFVAGCDADASKGNDEKDERIQALEQRLALMEQNQMTVPANTQSVQAADPSSLGAFQFNEIEHDFGTIEEGKVVEHTFKFINEGQAPLIMSNVAASCGCTTPDYTKTPVKPGEEGFVKVVFDSKSKSGVQSPTVSITANTQPSVTRLRLKGTVNSKNTASTAPAMGPVKR